MKTIDIILKEAGYTKAFLLKMEKKGICNWVGAKWGIQFTDRLRKYKYFQRTKKKKLLRDMDFIADIHDLDWYYGWGFITFIKSNYDLAIRMCQLLHWTTISARFITFCLFFFSVTLFGWKNYNWGWKTKK